VPVTLNSDDPAVFDAMGLSYDYFQVLVSSEATGLITLAQMARWDLGGARAVRNDVGFPNSVVHHGEKQGRCQFGSKDYYRGLP
jgi:hypothetical protein